jgi:hypothetical protein
LRFSDFSGGYPGEMGWMGTTFLCPPFKAA